MNATLADFQDNFLRALYAQDDVDGRANAIASQPGFAVYRNTVLKACIDALAANYPSVLTLVGAIWFQGAATAYAKAQPPTSSSLLDYGAGFPDFLAQSGSQSTLPYLADVARLDLRWMLAHIGADFAALEAAEIMHLAPVELGNTVLRPHPSAQWAWFPDMPVYTIWCASRQQRAPDSELEWRAEGALLTRRDNTVCWQAIPGGACTFLDACASGDTLEQACQHALLVEPTLDISRTLSDLINAAAFCSNGSYVPIDNQTST